MMKKYLAAAGAALAAVTLAACGLSGSSSKPPSVKATATVASAQPSVTVAKGTVAGCRAAVAKGEPMDVPACFGISYAQVSSAVPGTSPSSVAATASLSSAPPTASSSAAQQQQQTITYEVTGSPANVTYGPAGSSLSGTVPMKVTAKLGDPLYYSLQAQLQGGGSVTVKILVNGTVISQGTASGGYNIAMAEISQDPLSGQWTDTDQG